MPVSKSWREAGRYEVRVKGITGEGVPINVCYSRCNRQQTAMAAMITILQKWSANPDDIRPGTSVSIVDTHDGGKVIGLEYLGHADNLLTGR